MRWLTAQTTQQTILLAALFLLMAVATILLACGPVAQPAPADDVALPAAQDGGGSEEPTAEPTVEPTDTPVPNSTECVSIPPEYQATPELAEGQVRVDGIKYQCFVVTPTPTPKYPELGDLNWIAVAAEEAEAQRESSQAGGASGQSEVEVPVVHTEIIFSDQASTDAAFAWLQNNGVPLTEDVNEYWRDGIDNRVVAIYDNGWNFIEVIMPASLILPLSRQGGFVRFSSPPLPPTLD